MRVQIASMAGPAARLKGEDGAITVLSAFLFIIMLMFGGLAIDVSNLMTARTRLQVASDAAAHAALLARETETEAQSVAAGVEVAALNMPVGIYGNVMLPSDITFGVWDSTLHNFIPMAGSKSAVMVEPKTAVERQNPVATYLLKMVGVDAWNVRVYSVFTTYHPTCFQEGFVAQGVVDLQSNNSYTNGFCIHSNDYVTLNRNNYFEPGTVVSMPDTTRIDLPNSGFASNDGLSQALREGSFYIRIIERIDEIVAGLNDFTSDYMPDYITSTTIVTLNSQTAIDQTMLVPGSLHKMTCNNGNQVNVSAGTLFQNLVLITNCGIRFGQGAALEDAIIATTSTDTNSFNSASGLRVGRDDACADGGGAQLVTMGGMNFPADLQVYGGQLLAKGTISFAANANGVEGASFVAGGEISGTSNMAMGFCGSGMDDNLHAEYFRLSY